MSIEVTKHEADIIDSERVEKRKAVMKAQMEWDVVP